MPRKEDSCAAKPLPDLLKRPIPRCTAGSIALDYHDIPLDLSDPRSCENLCHLSSAGVSARSYYARTDGGNPPYFRRLPGALADVWVREGVVERLREANRLLKPHGAEVHVLDGYRPIRLQQALWDFFMERARQTLPEPTFESCRKFVGRYWSDPGLFSEDDFRTWPTHSTGAAVDLTLIKLGTDEPLFMGGSFDDTSEVSHTARFERLPCNSASADAEAKMNRRLLYWAMVEAGFINYPFEWWHFDYGTQMWAMNRASLFTKEEPVVPWYGYAGRLFEHA